MVQRNLFHCPWRPSDAWRGRPRRSLIDRKRHRMKSAAGTITSIRQPSSRRGATGVHGARGQGLRVQQRMPAAAAGPHVMRLTGSHCRPGAGRWRRGAVQSDHERLL